MTQPADVMPLLRIHWEKDKCTACLSCVVVCAERHVGASAPGSAHIRILVDLFSPELTAEYCRQCKKAACVAACPEQAIVYDANTHAWLVREDLCTGCGKCVPACRFGAIRLHGSRAVAGKCDLCRGAAWCVQACNAGALSVKGR